MELKPLKAGVCCQNNKRRDGNCLPGWSVRGTKGETEVDTPHQEHGDGPPNKRHLLLSGTFLAFHFRKMPHGQNVRNVLVNNKFLRVTEHISSSLSKKLAVSPLKLT